MITEYRIGERIKELRKKNGWTQEQVADKIGVTKSVVSFYERNNRTPSPEMHYRVLWMPFAKRATD